VKRLRGSEAAKNGHAPRRGRQAPSLARMAAAVAACAPALAAAAPLATVLPAFVLEHISILARPMLPRPCQRAPAAVMPKRCPACMQHACLSAWGHSAIDSVQPHLLTLVIW